MKRARLPVKTFPARRSRVFTRNGSSRGSDISYRTIGVPLIHRSALKLFITRRPRGDREDTADAGTAKKTKAEVERGRERGEGGGGGGSGQRRCPGVSLFLESNLMARGAISPERFFAHVSRQIIGGPQFAATNRSCTARFRGHACVRAPSGRPIPLAQIYRMCARARSCERTHARIKITLLRSRRRSRRVNWFRESIPGERTDERTNERVHAREDSR